MPSTHSSKLSTGDVTGTEVCEVMRDKREWEGEEKKVKGHLFSCDQEAVSPSQKFQKMLFATT